MRLPFVSFALLVASVSPAFAQYTSYISEWIRISYVLDGNFSNTTSVAQQTIENAAQWFSAQGPWCTSGLRCCLAAGA